MRLFYACFDRIYRGDLPRRCLPALHLELLQERAGQGPEVQEGPRHRYAQDIHSIKARDAAKTKTREVATELDGKSVLLLVTARIR